MKTIVIYIGGEGPSRQPVISDDVVTVIAADSGLELANTHGVDVDLVVGDMDSINPALLRQYAEAGTALQQFPHEKMIPILSSHLLQHRNGMQRNSLSSVVGAIGSITF